MRRIHRFLESLSRKLVAGCRAQGWLLGGRGEVPEAGPAKGRCALAPCHGLYFMLAALNELTAKGFFINSTWQPCISCGLSPHNPQKKPKKRNFMQKLNAIIWVDFYLGGGIFFEICQISLVAPIPGHVVWVG